MKKILFLPLLIMMLLIMGVWALFFNDSYKKYFAKDDNIFKQAFS